MIGIPLNRQVPFGRTTERFFVEGEQHEAQQWQDVILPPDDEPEPKRRRGSIDKVPRQRGAMVALSLFAICLVVGLGIGASELLKTGNRLDSFLTLFKASPSSAATSEQAQPAAPTNSQPVQPQVAPLPTELSQPSPPTIPPTPSAAPPAPGPVPVPAIVQPAPSPTAQPSAAPQKTRDEASRQERQAGLAQEDTATVERTEGAPDRRASHEAEKASSESVAKRQAHHRQHPRDNYVWSAEANALIPAMSDNDSTGGAATSTANPSTQQPNRVPRPNPFERNGLSPPRLPESTIAPATTGAPTAERPASKSDDADPFQK